MDDDVKQFIESLSPAQWATIKQVIGVMGPLFKALIRSAEAVLDDEQKVMFRAIGERRIKEFTDGTFKS